MREAGYVYINTDDGEPALFVREPRNSARCGIVAGQAKRPMPTHTTGHMSNPRARSARGARVPAGWNLFNRTDAGALIPAATFTNSTLGLGSLKALADALHAKHFKFGIYLAAGYTTCGHRAGMPPPTPTPTPSPPHPHTYLLV